MKSLRYILLLVYAVEISTAQAQDVRFSSFEASPMFLNPALTGFHSEQFRATTIYRNQWSSVSTGYNSFLLTAESHIYNSKRHKTGLALGLEFLSDVAGSLSYGSRNIGVALSFFKTFTGQSVRHTISFAVKANRQSYGYDLSNAQFGNHNTNIIEGIPLNQFSTFDISFGTHWQTAFSTENIIECGLAVYHLNEPTMSYFETSTIVLPMRYTFYSTYLFPSSKHFWKPSILVQVQDRTAEILAGGEMITDLNPMIGEEKSIAFGIYYRALDAGILTCRFHYNDLNIGISYDINLSKLTPASKTYGAAELWLNYTFGISQAAKRQSRIPCPVF